MRICYILGIGVEKEQVASLALDFVNMALITVYIMTYRNPILRKSMRKVFFQFPQPDNPKKWDRLDDIVKKQVTWIYNPKRLMELDDALLPPEYDKDKSNYKHTTLKLKQ